MKTGIEANSLITVPAGMLPSLADSRHIAYGAVANVFYEVNGGNADFFNFGPIGDLASTDADEIKYEGLQIGRTAVPLDLVLNKGVVLGTKAVQNMDARSAAIAFGAYLNQWDKQVLGKFFAEVVKVPEHTAVATELGDIIEEMIVALQEKGYARQDLTVALSAKAYSKLRSIAYGVVNLVNPSGDLNTSNFFATGGLVEVGTFLGTNDVAVYVRDYALLATDCTIEPSIFPGTENYKGRTLIQGEICVGAKVYDAANVGLRYTIA